MNVGSPFTHCLRSAPLHGTPHIAPCPHSTVSPQRCPPAAHSTGDGAAASGVRWLWAAMRCSERFPSCTQTAQQWGAQWGSAQPALVQLMAVEELRCGNSSSLGTASPPAALWAVQPPAVLCPWPCPGLRSADGGLLSPGSVWVNHSRCGGQGRSLQPPRTVPPPPSSWGWVGWRGEGRRGEQRWRALSVPRGVRAAHSAAGAPAEPRVGRAQHRAE